MRTFLRKQYKSELSFYHLHHQHQTNWRIHFICVPIEWLSWFLLCCYVTSPFPIATIIALYYMMIGSYDSYKASALILLLSCGAIILFNVLNKYSWWVVLILQVFSWLIQVRIGHFYYERNRPGMMEMITVNSIVLSLFLAVDTTTIRSDLNQN